MAISPQRRDEIIDALRRGTVPRSSLDAFAVGLERFEGAIEEDLHKVVGAGGSVFKAVRGEYGCGKTFYARWLADRARKLGFATSEVQISETETPLHRVETVFVHPVFFLPNHSTTAGHLPGRARPVELAGLGAVAERLEAVALLARIPLIQDHLDRQDQPVARPDGGHGDGARRVAGLARALEWVPGFGWVRQANLPDERDDDELPLRKRRLPIQTTRQANRAET